MNRGWWRCCRWWSSRWCMCMNRGWWRCSIRGCVSIAGLRVGVILVLWWVVWRWFRISLWLVWRVVWFWLRWIVGLLLRWVVRFLRWVVWLGAWLWVLRVIRRRLLWVLRVISRLRVSWFMSRLMLGWRWWGSIGIVRLRFRIGFRVLLGIGLVDRLLVFRLWVGLWIWLRVWLVGRLGVLLRIWLRVLLGVRLVHWLMVLRFRDWFSSRLRVGFRNRSRVDRGRVGWWGRRVVRWRWWTIRISISSHDLVVASVLLELVHGDP